MNVNVREAIPIYVASADNVGPESEGLCGELNNSAGRRQVEGLRELRPSENNVSS